MREAIKGVLKYQRPSEEDEKMSVTSKHQNV